MRNKNNRSHDCIEKMDDKHIKILNWFEKELLVSLNIQSLLEPLRNNKLITSWEEKRLEKHVETDLTSRTYQAKEIFLHILKTKGPEAFGKFLIVLRNDEEHLGHKSLYNKLIQHEHGNLPRPLSEPADLQSREQLVLSPVRHNSLKMNSLGPNMAMIAEESAREGVETRLEEIFERLQSLEAKIDFISEHGTANKAHLRASDRPGLLSMPSVKLLKVSF